jgi:hypothetical protein
VAVIVVIVNVIVSEEVAGYCFRFVVRIEVHIEVRTERENATPGSRPELEQSRSSIDLALQAVGSFAIPGICPTQARGRPD